MHTEGDIRAAIPRLLGKYGKLTTSEIKQRIEEVIDLDEEDKTMSETRNEMLIIQRIGNIVSHQREPIKTYSEGFTVKKNNPNDEMAIFYLSNGNNR